MYIYIASACSLGVKLRHGWILGRCFAAQTAQSDVNLRSPDVEPLRGVACIQIFGSEPTDLADGVLRQKLQVKFVLEDLSPWLPNPNKNNSVFFAPPPRRRKLVPKGEILS